QLTLVEGLDGDRAALLTSMHHTITDGIGGVRMAAMFLGIDRDAPDEPTLDLRPPKQTASPSVGASVRSAVSKVVGSVRDPIGTVRSIGNQLIVVDGSRSPLWQGRRSLGRRFDTVRVDLEAAKKSAHGLGGTLNDLYVAGVVRGIGAYHRSRGAPA